MKHIFGSSAEGPTSQKLSPGRQVPISESVEKYGGFFGEIVYREWYSDTPAYRREHPDLRARQGRLMLVVELENSPPGLEPVILCYQEQVSPVSTD